MPRFCTGLERSTPKSPSTVSALGTLRSDGGHENRFLRFGLENDSAELFAERVHDQLSPRTLIEEVLVDRLISASWTLMQTETAEILTSREARVAERSLCRAISALSKVRDRSAESIPVLKAQPEPERWRSRLVMDLEVSDSSPVIRGTWITVEQVISRIVEGWTWDDLLRDHPELTTDDIRACLAFTIEDEEAR